MVLQPSERISREPKEGFRSVLTTVLDRLGINELNTVQRIALEQGVLKGVNFMVVAPSGSGKTLIALMSILKLLVEEDQNKKAVLLVPLKALALQHFNWMKGALGEMGVRVAINTGDFSPTINKGDLSTDQVLIMTYERFDSIIRSKSWWLKRIKVVVIDEINYLSEKVRGPRLEATIVRLKENMPYTQLIALCPPIGNAAEIADWLECKLIVGDQRPIPLSLEVIQTNSMMKTAIELSVRTVSQGGSVIVFASSRSRSEQIASSLLKPLQCVVTEKQKTDARALTVMLLRSNDEILTVTRRLASAMQGCVAFHHAGLRSEDRSAVEEGFREGIIKAVVCTTTLGTGVNSPARMVIITDTSYLDVEPTELSSRAVLKRIEPDRLHQMLGRAGRLGYDSVGHGVILVDGRAEEEYVKRTYFGATKQDKKGYVGFTPPAIKSQMPYEFAMVEQLLARIYECGECTAEELLDFLTRTLWWKTKTEERQDIEFLLKAESFNPEDTLELVLRLARKGSEIKVSRNPVTDTNISNIVSGNKGNQKEKINQNVRILCVSKDRIEARIRKGDGSAWVACSFSTSGARCDCAKTRLGEPRSEWREASRLCEHLIRLARCLLLTASIRLHAQEIIVRSLSSSLPLDRLLHAGLITFVNDKYTCTELGNMTAGLYMHPLTVVFIRNSFDKLCTNDELDEKSMINIALRALLIEGGEKSSLFRQDTAMRALIQWMDEECEEEILRSSFVAPGDLYELTVEVGRVSSAASTIAKHLGLVRLCKQFSVVSRRIRFGVKQELIPLMELSIPSLGRRLVRELYDLGYTSEAELLRAPAQELTDVARLSGDTVTMIKQHLERLVGYKQRAQFS